MSDGDSPDKKMCTSSHTRTAVIAPAALLRRAVLCVFTLATFLCDNLVVRNHTSNTQEVIEEEVSYCTKTASKALTDAVDEAVYERHTHVTEVDLRAARLEYQDALAKYNESTAALENVDEDDQDYQTCKSKNDQLREVYNTALAALDEADKKYQAVSPKLKELRALKNKADEAKAIVKNAKSKATKASAKNAKSSAEKALTEARQTRNAAVNKYDCYRNREFENDEFTSTPDTLWTCFATKYNRLIREVNDDIDEDSRFYVIPSDCVKTPTKECLKIFRELFLRSFTQRQNVASDCFTFLDKTTNEKKRKRSDNDDKTLKRRRQDSLEAKERQIQAFAATLMEKIQGAMRSE